MTSDVGRKLFARYRARFTFGILVVLGFAVEGRLLLTRLAHNPLVLWSSTEPGPDWRGPAVVFTDYGVACAIALVVLAQTIVSVRAQESPHIWEILGQGILHYAVGMVIANMLSATVGISILHRSLSGVWLSLDSTVGVWPYDRLPSNGSELVETITFVGIIHGIALLLVLGVAYAIGTLSSGQKAPQQGQSKSRPG